MKKIYKKVMFGAAILTACLAFVFASCNPAAGVETPDNDQPPNPTQSPTPTVTPTATSTPQPDLSIKFGITTSGTRTEQEVSDTFTAVHAYLATTPQTVSGTEFGDIALGDYIDLVSLSITADAGGGGAALNYLSDSALLRLIVVGINTFREGPGKDNTVTYATNGSDAAPHLVFQFQNIPVTHSMNDPTTSDGGYAASEMRTYLINNFLPGLKAAGVPDSVFWAPKRFVANNGGAAINVTDADEVQDELWLPTEREMFGSRSNSNDTYETAGNQARLAYYTNPASRIKSDGAGPQYYWMASPVTGFQANFCRVGAAGTADRVTASTGCGVAPAFCVK